MRQVSVQMPMVSKCDAKTCGYNAHKKCHAKAITIGGSSIPDCDTYMEVSEHIREQKRIAGVGACKVRECKFNDDFECNAPAISVGLTDNRVNCLTFSEKH